VPILGYIEEQYANFLSHELRADRSNLEDSRIHVALYFIEPTGHPLTALDIVAMQGIGKLTNLIPVIAKADTLTAEELAKFKKLVFLFFFFLGESPKTNNAARQILNDISNHGINIYQVPIESDDEESTKLNKEISVRSGSLFFNLKKQVLNNFGIVFFFRALAHTPSSAARRRSRSTARTSWAASTSGVSLKVLRAQEITF